MNKNEVIEAIKNYDSHQIKVAVTDIDGILRGKYISKAKFLKALEGGFGFCNVVFGWDINDACYDQSQVSGWHTGYPDDIATIDFNTYRHIPWEEQTAFFLADFRHGDQLNEVCPRTLLTKVRQSCLDLGFTPLFSNEFEWFNFKETPTSWHEKGYRHPQPLTPGMFGYSMLRTSLNDAYFRDLFTQLRQFDVPLEGLHTETGDGVFEAAIEYCDVLEAADRAILFKSGVKAIAYQHDIMASFMAKWNKNLPGCSGHIHQSLWSNDLQQNLFYDEVMPYHISSLMKQYIAGQLHCLPHILPLYAPSVNSYKRFVAGSWAATSISWGVDNRTTALRAIPSGKQSIRLETRVPGADINPYVAMSAALASGLYGIKHELPLDSQPIAGSAYDEKDARPLPENLGDAITNMENSPIMEELFGSTFTQHFIQSREWEWRQFHQDITDWELKRYFEII